MKMVVGPFRKRARRSSAKQEDRRYRGEAENKGEGKRSWKKRKDTGWMGEGWRHIRKESLAPLLAPCTFPQGAEQDLPGRVACTEVLRETLKWLLAY